MENSHLEIIARERTKRTFPTVKLCNSVGTSVINRQYMTLSYSVIMQS